MKTLVKAFLITIFIGLIIYFISEYFNKDEVSENNDIKYIFDVSFATIIKSEELQNLVKNNNEVILMVGNKDNESSAKMSTYLKEIANDYNLNIYYLEKKNNDNIYQEYINSDSNLKEYASFIPVLLIFKDNKFINAYPGDAKYRNLESFLEYNGIIKGEVKDE